jgi:hypothetical protein
MRRKLLYAAGSVTSRSSVEPRPSLLDGFADDQCCVLAGLHHIEMDVEEREGQPNGPIPKAMMCWFLPVRRENSALSNPQTQPMMIGTEREVVKCFEINNYNKTRTPNDPAERKIGWS